MNYFDLTIIFINILNRTKDNNTLIVHITIKNIINEINIQLITKFSPYIVK